METPPTKLDHYRLLGRSGLRVSPLCLGTMTFGSEWGWGADRDESRLMLYLYMERGGNFIDTANLYTSGISETYLGEFLEGRRDNVVLATKFTMNMRQGDPNAGGNHRKCIMQSVEASLQRLRTDYIDLYWVHAWEFRTPVDEVMRALDDLVRMGKVLYIGISDAYAYKVAQANTLADMRGWSPFIALQIEYSLIERTVERELIPMALDLNLGVTPWSPLGGGILTGKYSHNGNEPAPQPARGQFVTERMQPGVKGIVGVVKSIAEETGQTPAQVAVGWVMRQPGVTSPIVGARSVKQLEENLSALDCRLAPEHIQRLNQVSQIDLGFPTTYFAKPRVKSYISGGTEIEER